MPRAGGGCDDSPDRSCYGSAQVTGAACLPACPSNSTFEIAHPPLAGTDVVVWEQLAHSSCAGGWEHGPADFVQHYGAVGDNMVCVAAERVVVPCSGTLHAHFQSDINQAESDEAWAFSDFVVRSAPEVGEAGAEGVCCANCQPPDWQLIAEEAVGVSLEIGASNHMSLLDYNMEQYTGLRTQIRIEWGEDSFVQFETADGGSLFRYKGADTRVQGLTSSEDMFSGAPGGSFCNVCTENSGCQGGGDTCWAVTPLDGAGLARDIGCNSGDWNGRGVYYSGCSYTGGFSGAKEDRQQKAGFPGVGVRIYAKSPTAPC